MNIYQRLEPLLPEGVYATDHLVQEVVIYTRKALLGCYCAFEIRVDPEGLLAMSDADLKQWVHDLLLAASNLQYVAEEARPKDTSRTITTGR